MKRERAERRGRQGELRAAWWLRLLGWRILARRVKTPRGEIQIIDPTAFRDRYGVVLEAQGQGMRLAALRLAVRDKAVLQAALRASGVESVEHGPNTIVGPQAAFGATLIFEAN